MREWYIDHLTAHQGDVEHATEACAEDFDELTETEQRIVIRKGLRDGLADARKAVTVTIRNAGRPDDQLPLAWSVPTNGRWVVVDYLRFNLRQLREARRAENERNQASTERLVRMDIDIELYERHQDCPDVESVYRLEGVEFVVETAATG